MLRLLLAITFTCFPANLLASDLNDALPAKNGSVQTKVRFQIEVMSILSKAGCNAGTCHGNLNGKGGLKFSLRGQDPWFDYEALIAGSRGRRVNLAAPAKSLVLQKATGNTPHRGGIRFAVDSKEYRQLLVWLNEGAVGPQEDTPALVRIDVEPEFSIKQAPIDHVQVKVQAHFSDGNSRDVTSRACYELSNLRASVSSGGKVSREKFGETTLIVRYLDRQKAIPIAFIDPPEDFQWPNLTPDNVVDEHVFSALENLSVSPSGRCNDSTFARRVTLDIVGRIPTANEARSFVSSADLRKREKLVDRLLASEEFADYWALKFADILRVEEKVLDPKGVDLFHAWIRQQMLQGVPHDEFVRALVTGTGSTFKNPAANFYRANRDPATRGETAARLFLGTRLQCAKCHNHPFDRWTQDDYYQWSTLFSQIDYEVGDNERKDRLDKNEFAGDQVVLVAKKDEVKNPTTGKSVQPKFLGDAVLQDQAQQNRLQAVADWIASPDNELFTKSQVNFVWFHMMGVGLVDPIDDFRLTNPASNPALLSALADSFANSGFDIRKLIRTIALSQTYQAASTPEASNKYETAGFSRAKVRRLNAEVLLDAQSDFLQTPARFAGYPTGLRAVEIPGVKRVRARDTKPQDGDRFLKTFGKPERILACDCERSNETNLKQVLGLLGDSLNDRLERSPLLRNLAEGELADRAVVDELYWSALSRPPTSNELNAALEMLVGSDGPRVVALQDISWALLNAKEFLFRN